MKASSLLILSAAVLLGAAGVADSADTPHTGDPQVIARGEYLVQHVAMCGDCHSPRDAKGALIPDKQLAGASLGFAALHPMPWSAYAPAIAGLPSGWSASDMAQFLMSGQRPFDLPPVNPPMPAYRLNQADAEAVAAYLQSLGKPKP